MLPVVGGCGHLRGGIVALPLRGGVKTNRVAI